MVTPKPGALGLAYVQTFCTRPDGSRDTFHTIEVKCKYAPMTHHLAGLTWTASGYGKRIPMRYMVMWHGRWRRVYVCSHSNAGAAYIGRLADNLTVTDIKVQP